MQDATASKKETIYIKWLDKREEIGFMMKRHFKKIAAMVLAMTMVANLTGCGGNTGSAQKQEKDVKSINVLMWEGDASEEVFDNFTKKTGIKVNVTYIEDTNTILSKMMNGNDEYDLIDIESAYVDSFVQAGLLAPLDYDKITNKKYIDSIYLKKGAVGDRKFKYTIPCSGPLYTAVVYNKETCPIEIKDFSDLADPKLKGSICSVNATISLYAGALRALGYSENSTSEEEIKKASELLTKVKKNVKVFVGASALSQLESGDCSVGYCWEYNQLCLDSKDNWDKYEIVESTALGYNQFWSIAASSTKQAAATKLINFMNEPKQQAISCKEYGGVPTIKKEYIEKYLPKDFYDMPYIEKYAEMWLDHTDLAVSDEQNTIMDTYYTELMSGE